VWNLKEDLFINGTQNVARELVRTGLLGLAGAAEAGAHHTKLEKNLTQNTFLKNSKA
jgi:hypothetical protein